MSLVALVSAKRSPGVTTAAVALASVWPGGPALVIECDPAGGDLAADAGLPLEPGLTSLAASRRHGFTAEHLAAHAQRMPCGANAIMTPPSPDGARAALSTLSGRLAAGLAALPDMDAFADCGRFEPQSAATPFLAAADLVVMVVRPSLAGVEHAAARIDQLRNMARSVGILLIGEHPYPAKEVGAYLAVEVVGVLADDPVGAAVLPTETAARRLERSPLLRSARSVSDQLALRMHADRNRHRLTASAASGVNGHDPHALGGRR